MEKGLYSVKSSENWRFMSQHSALDKGKSLYL